MPNSIVGIFVRSNTLALDVQIPLNDFESAFGEKPDLSATQKLDEYFQKHLKIEGTDGVFWKLELEAATISEITDPNTGAYVELRTKFRAWPPTGANLRQFTLWYDVVLHQVVTHQAIVHVEQDWENGIAGQNTQTLATLNVDSETGKVLPLLVNLTQGSVWKGLQSMFRLGMSHIAEGVDHLIFLWMLLLIAPLNMEDRRWAGFGGLRTSFWRLVKIVTAFTLGHSLTLAMCSVGWFRFPSQRVEILVAVSILVSAVHVLRPIVFGKETFIAAGFGLIHGMAFSNTLADFHLDTAQLLWSILGFNLGIEAMQVFIVLLVFPFLIILSKSNIYPFFKNTLAVFGILSALAWIVQRWTGTDNAVSLFVDGLMDYPGWIWGGLVLLTGLVWLRSRKSSVPLA